MEVDWGNGYIQTLVGTATTATYTYPDLGRFSITVRPTDEDGTYRNFPVFLNQSFGVNGSVRTDFTGNSNFSSLAIGPNGSYVMGGGHYFDYGESGNWDFLLTKQLPSGALDTTFASGGVVTAGMEQWQETPTQDVARQVALRPNGKVVLLGFDEYSPAIIQYNENGSLDTSFGYSGRVIPTVQTGQITSQAIFVQPDEKILVAGSILTTPNVDFVIQRVNEDGTPDYSFGNGGSISTDVSGGDDFLTSIALQADGKILALGRTVAHGSGNLNFGTRFNLGLTRYNRNGSLDRTFNTTGRIILDMASTQGILGENSKVLIQDDGKIVIVGNTQVSANRQGIVLARYLPNGLPDPDFGTNGRALVDIAAGQNGSPTRISMTDAVIRADGKIFVTGTSQDGGSQPVLVRIDENGTLENGGTVFLGQSGQTPIGLAVRENGELDVVLGGVNHATGNYSTHILRVLSSNAIAVVNYEPSGADKSISIVGNTPYFFSPSDFGYIDISESYKLLGVSISTLPNPQEGKLQLSNNLDVTVDQFIPLRDIANLRFIPAYGMTGTNKGAFTFQVHDSSGTSPSEANSGQTVPIRVNTDPSPNTISFKVSPGNSIPTISFRRTVQMLEDEVSEPIEIYLQDDATPVNDLTVEFLSDNGELIRPENVLVDRSTNPIRIRLAPRSNQSGQATLTVSVYDGTTRGFGSISINVNPVNDAPETQSFKATQYAGQALPISWRSFPYRDTEKITMSGIVITSPPAIGQLRIGSRVVVEGTAISLSELNTLGLVYYAPNGGTNATSTTFRFQVLDGINPSAQATTQVDFIANDPLRVDYIGLLHNQGSNIEPTSSNPTLAGWLAGQIDPDDVIKIQFDHNLDGTSDGDATINPINQSFIYDPRKADNSFSSRVGPTEVRYRVHQSLASGGRTLAGKTGRRDESRPVSEF